MYVFPDLSATSQGWSVTRDLTWEGVTTQRAASGRETRILNQLHPQYVWTFTYERLRDQWDRRAGPGIGSGVGVDELRRLAGFWLAHNGPFKAFLYDDPSDNRATGQSLGQGDGVTTTFQLIRSYGVHGFYEPIYAPREVEGVNLDDGFLGPDAWTVDYDTGLVTFTDPPGAGVVIRVDMSYYHRCRFDGTSTSFENFAYQLWSNKSLKIRTDPP